MPYFVVAGCLAATGWLLFVVGVRMSLGRAPLASGAAFDAADWARLASGAAVFALLLLLRRRLAGYLFFGSSEGAFEHVRRDLGGRPPGAVSDVILDFARVAGIDTSAAISLVKLRHLCRRSNVARVFSAAAPGVAAAMARDGVFALSDDPQALRPSVDGHGALMAPAAG